MRTPRAKNTINSFKNHSTPVDKGTVSAASSLNIPGNERKRKKHRLYTAFAVVYSIGVLLCAFFLLADSDESSYALLFIQTRLGKFAVAAPQFYLASQLQTAVFTLLLLLFLHYSAFGAPILLLSVTGKGFLRTLEIVCITAQLCNLQLAEYLLRYALYDFGCTLVLFPTATAAFRHCNAMFNSFFRKKRFPEIRSSPFDRILGTFVGIFLWCLLVYALNRLWV